MRIKTILNRVERHPGFVYGDAVFDKDVRLLVPVAARKGCRPQCSGCGMRGPTYDTRPSREFRFVPLWGMAVFFVYAMRRVDCERCGVKVESVSWASGKEHSTTTLLWFLAMWAKRLSWQETAEAFGSSWRTVFMAVRMAVAWGRAHLVLGTIEAIGVDELSWRRKGKPKFITLVYQLDAGCRRLLAIHPDRREGSLRPFFEWIGAEGAASIRFVCSDMWKPYLKVLKEKASQAIHVIDPFHIAQHLSEAIDQVRRSEVETLRLQGRIPILKDSRWSLLRRPENRTEKDEAKLKDLVRFNLKSVRACLLRWDFDSFWSYTSATWAGQFLDRWCTRAMRSQLVPMKRVVRMLRNHRPYLMAWFKAKDHLATGAVEGLNNRARAVTKRSYGFRTFKVLETALYHTLGHLPEPRFTHRFW